MAPSSPISSSLALTSIGARRDARVDSASAFINADACHRLPDETAALSHAGILFVCVDRLLYGTAPPLYVCWCRSAHAFLLQHTENLTDQGFTLAFESSSIGSSHIYAHARARGIKIAFSGAGGDEIYTDYWHTYPLAGNPPLSGHRLGVPKGTRPRASAANPTGGSPRIFPEDLEPVFPWFHFQGGMQRIVLRICEMVAGAHGMEGRYPLLDVDFVQEFLWLSADLKNSRVKAPLVNYLQNASYPHHNMKLGFNIKSYLRGSTRDTKWDCAPESSGMGPGACLPPSTQG